MFTRHELALMGITLVWGGTFLAVAIAMEHGGPMLFVGSRFGMAGLAVAALFHRRMAGLTWAEVRAGAVIGSMIFAGYSLQTAGLVTIPSSTSAFITAFYVPVVPILQWLMLSRPPQLASWIGTALAFVGLLLLAGPQGGGFAIGFGEALTIAGAIAIALEVVFISMFANGVDTARVTVVQCLTAAVLGFGAAFVAGEGIGDTGPLFWIMALVLGAASALIQTVMNWAQKEVSPTRATLIYTGEPVYAAIIGWLVGEALGLGFLIGGALVLAGILVAELSPKR